MKTVSIYNGDLLVEKWVLQDDGRAALTYLFRPAHGQSTGLPLYPTCGGVDPSNGEEYLERLIISVSRSTSLGAVIDE